MQCMGHNHIVNNYIVNNHVCNAWKITPNGLNIIT